MSKEINVDIAKDIDNLLKTYNDNIVVKLSKIDNKGIFLYFLIVIIFGIVIKYYNLNPWPFLIIALFLIYMIYSKREIDNISTKEQSKIKAKLIRSNEDPILNIGERFEDYPDIIEFLFSIRYFYYINTNAFSMMILHLNNFFDIYEDVMDKEVLNCKYNYDIILYSARSILNNLHSMIFNIDVDKKLTKKYQLSMKQFHIIIYQYINKIMKKCKIQPTGPQGRNFYIDDFEIY